MPLWHHVQSEHNTLLLVKHNVTRGAPAVPCYNASCVIQTFIGFNRINGVVMHNSTLHIDNIVKMYKSGLSCSEIAEHFGVSKSSITARARRAGLRLRDLRDGLPETDIVNRYLSGSSENQVAAEYGVSRKKIRSILNRQNVSIRGQSEAETLKWSKMTQKQRRSQVAAAHQAIRNMPTEFHYRSSELQAKTKEKTLSKSCDMELMFIAEFEELGFFVTPQKAVGPYNIDIAIGGSAVEIHGSWANPHTSPYYRKRIMHLLEAGWHVFYIKTPGKINAKRAAQKVGQMINLAQSDESGIRHYGMVRGSGDFMASGCLDGDEFSAVDGSNAFFEAVA